jgi:hypothetical protein
VQRAICRAATDKSPGPGGLPIEKNKNTIQSSPESSKILCDALEQFLTKKKACNQVDHIFCGN